MKRLWWVVLVVALATACGGGDDTAMDAAAGDGPSRETGSGDASTTVSVSGEVICSSCTGSVLVAAFDNLALEGDPIELLTLGGAGPFSFTFERGFGDVYLLALGDNNDNVNPDEGEPFLIRREPITIGDEDVTGIVLDLDAAGDACADHALRAEVDAVPAYGLEVTVDGDTADWEDAPPQLLDAPAASDDCSPETRAGADLRELFIAQTRFQVVFRVGFAGEAPSDGEFIIELRQLEELPWGAGNLDVIVRLEGGEWVADLFWVPAEGGAPEPWGLAEAALGDGVLEVAIDREDIGALDNYRVRARVMSPDGEDATRYVQVAAGPGRAGPDGAVVDPAELFVLMVESATRAEFEEALSAVPGAEVAHYDEEMASGGANIDATTIPEAEAAATAISAHAQVDIAFPRAVSDGRRGLSRNNLQDFVGARHDVVAWAYLETQAMDAQTVVAACSNLVSLTPVRVAVVDSDIPRSVTGDTNIQAADGEFPGATVFDYERTNNLSFHFGWALSHGLSVASVIGMASDLTLGAAPRTEFSVRMPPMTGLFCMGRRTSSPMCTDRLSGVLSFSGTNPAFTFPLRLELHNRSYTSNGGTSWDQIWDVLAARTTEVGNHSSGVALRQLYCRDPACFDATGFCHCFADLATRSGCGDIEGTVGTRERMDGYGMHRRRGMARLERAGVNYVFAASNECDDLDNMNHTASFAAASRETMQRRNVIIVGALDRDEPGALSISGTSNYGRKVDIWAPGVGVLSWAPRVGHVHTTAGGATGTVSDRMVDRSRYGLFGGTSMATPLVTAAAGLVRSIDPRLTAAETRQTLIDTAESSPALATAGVLNYARAATHTLLDRAGVRASRNAVLTIASTPGDFRISCSTGPSSGEMLASEMGLGCVPIHLAADGTITGGSGDPALGVDTSYYTVTGHANETGFSVTIWGTTFSPGPGPSTTTFTGTVSRPDTTSATAVHIINGRDVSGRRAIDGSVTLRSREGVVTDACTWSGGFSGRIYMGS